MASTTPEPDSGKPATATTETKPDPVLKQPEKSHMHSKDAHPSGDTDRPAKKPV